MTDIVAYRRHDLDTLAQQIRAEHDAFEQLARSAVEHAIRAGNLLIEAKSQVRHGEWLPWLQALGIPERTAQRYMRVARNSDTVSDSSSLRAALAEVTEPHPQRAPVLAPAPEPPVEMGGVAMRVSPLDEYFHAHHVVPDAALAAIQDTCNEVGVEPLIARTQRPGPIPWVWYAYIEPLPDETGILTYHPGWATFCDQRWVLR